MDDGINLSQEDIQRLSPTDLRDLQNFVQAKNQEANVQRSKSTITTRFKHTTPDHTNKYIEEED